MNRFVHNGCCLPLRAAWPDTKRGPSCCVRAEAASALISSNLDLESHQPVLVVMAGPSTRVIHARFRRAVGLAERRDSRRGSCLFGEQTVLLSRLRSAQ